MAIKKNNNSVNNSGSIPERKKPGRKKAAETVQAITSSSESETIRKRGRPKGSVDKTERKKRSDHDIQANSGTGENAKMIRYAMAFSDLPDIDYNNPEQVKQRTIDLFNISAAFDIKPSVAALAMAFHVDRRTLFDWLNGKSERIKNQKCLLTIKNAYNQINLLYETYMNTGKINPVAGIFLMKNNMGYKDTTDYIITANQDKQVNISDIAERSGLLSE